MKLTIGSTDYDLKVTNIPDEVDADICGYIDTAKCEIYLSNAYEKQTRLQSFWHEIVHGMFDEIGMRELGENEGLVDALGKQLYGLFLRNDLDKIYNYISEAKCKK